MGCAGVMVLLRLMVGGLEERPRWVEGGQGPREKRPGVGRMDWDGISLSPWAVRPPRCSAVVGAGADDRQTALNLACPPAVGGPSGMENGALSKTGDTTSVPPPRTPPCLLFVDNCLLFLLATVRDLGSPTLLTVRLCSAAHVQTCAVEGLLAAYCRGRRSFRYRVYCV